MRDDDANELAFRDLSLELANAAAGSFDGARVTVSFANIDDSVVAHHEAIHQRISLTTPDGMLLSMCMEATRTQLPPAFGSSLAGLMDQSIDAHEAGATYLSLKMLSPAAESAVLPRLPEKYTRWYHLFADVIDDRLASSSFLQYIIGQSVVSVAFFSPFLRSAVKADWSARFSPPTDCQPNFRMDLILHALRQRRRSEITVIAQAVADKACAAAGCSSWDIQSEEAWNSKDADPTVVEPALMMTFFDYLRRQSNLAVLEERDREPTYSQFTRRLGENDFAAEIRPHGSNVEERLKTESEVFALKQADSVIRNSHCRVPSRSRTYLPSLEQLFSPTLSIAISRQATGPNRLWVFLIFTHEPDGSRKMISDLTCSEQEAVEWLKLRQLREDDKVPVCSIILVLLGVESADDLEQTQRSLSGVLCRGRSSDWPAWVDASLCWYLGFNIIEWSRREGRVGKFRSICSRAQVDPNVEPGTSDHPLDTGGMGVIGLREEALPGTQIRLLSWTSAPSVHRELLGSKRHEGVFLKSEIELFETLMRTAGEVVIVYWSEY